MTDLCWDRLSLKTRAVGASPQRDHGRCGRRAPHQAPSRETRPAGTQSRLGRADVFQELCSWLSFSRRPQKRPLQHLNLGEAGLPSLSEGLSATLCDPRWDAPAPDPTPGYGRPGKGGPVPWCHPNQQKLGKGREGGEWGRGLYQLSGGSEAVGSVSRLFPLVLHRVSASCWPRKKRSQGCDHPL